MCQNIERDQRTRQQNQQTNKQKKKMTKKKYEKQQTNDKQKKIDTSAVFVVLQLCTLINLYAPNESGLNLNIGKYVLCAHRTSILNEFFILYDSRVNTHRFFLINRHNSWHFDAKNKNKKQSENERR